MKKHDHELAKKLYAKPEKNMDDLIEQLIQKARRTHTGELAFAEFCHFLRYELQQQQSGTEPLP
jgi:hypothetical protein